MGDLISRSAVKGILSKGSIVIDEDVEKCESMHDVLVYLLEKVDDFVQKSVDEIPAVDAVPVVHGEWIMRGGRLYCSNCGKKALEEKDRDDWYGCEKSNWCPHCGADMRKKVQHETD